MGFDGRNPVNVARGNTENGTNGTRSIGICTLGTGLCGLLAGWKDISTYDSLTDSAIRAHSHRNLTPNGMEVCTF